CNASSTEYFTVPTRERSRSLSTSIPTTAYGPATTEAASWTSGTSLATFAKWEAISLLVKSCCSTGSESSTWINRSLSSLSSGNDCSFWFCCQPINSVKLKKDSISKRSSLYTPPLS